MAGKVLREDGRVWIYGVPGFSEVGSPVRKFPGAMVAALAVAPHPLSVDDILALS